MPTSRPFCDRDRARARDSCPAALLAAVQQALREADSRIALARPTTMDDVVAASIGDVLQVRFFLGLLAAVALVVGAVGVYGVVSYSVSGRTADTASAARSGEPTDPVQFIDARDLAEWTIRMVEVGATGTYNAVGPRARLGLAEMLYGMRASVSNDIRFTWVDADFLDAQGVRPWSDLPVWLPARGETAGFGSFSNEKAVAAGLTFRPLCSTVEDTLAWWDAQDDERRTQPMRAGLTAEREAEVLAAWHAATRASSG